MRDLWMYGETGSKVCFHCFSSWNKKGALNSGSKFTTREEGWFSVQLY